MEDELTASLPPEIAHKLGYYVYPYMDTRTNLPFYVGKGQGARVLAHLSAHGESRKAQVMEELRRVGLTPRTEILAQALIDEETALRIEAAVIDLFLFELGKLTNEIRGWLSTIFTRPHEVFGCWGRGVRKRSSRSQSNAATQGRSAPGALGVYRPKSLPRPTVRRAKAADSHGAFAGRTFGTLSGRIASWFSFPSRP